MKNLLLVLLVVTCYAGAARQPATGRYVLVIHGGAGTILRSQMSPEREKAYTQALDGALKTGNSILAAGGSALDAVEAALRTLEDNPLFNAGKGAVFTADGRNELDAAIMDGKTLRAGAVAGVSTIRNPITAARAVMEHSQHVLLTGRGAEEFARLNGLQMTAPSYFFTEERWKGLLNARRQDSLQQRHSDSSGNNGTGLLQPGNNDYKYGTVGAVALDMQGNLAAATSTGGMTNKRYGRVGDSPIIGAGTYANNATVAISCTGWGEYFIRLVMAKTISDRMEYGKETLNEAANDMIMNKLPDLGGDGGLIAVDKDGNIAMPFCTAGMYRGYITSEGRKEILIYKP